MIMKVYTIKDTLGSFGAPLTFTDEANAKRTFAAIIRRKKEQEYTEGKYFNLYEIGTYDTEHGTIVGYPESQQKLIMEGESFDEQKN